MKYFIEFRVSHITTLRYKSIMFWENDLRFEGGDFRIRVFNPWDTYLMQEPDLDMARQINMVI